MQYDQINALSTAVIAFVTIIGLMTGFYYNLWASDVKALTIIMLEFLFLMMLWIFTIWTRRKIKHE